ncbi:peptide ABC transporter substrate-binding protein [Plantibacter sp. Leaf171]|nr:peptide ABC transporter substrate-binding protein [Plantibacter sp. Leaf1]KQR57375.1 peptide ABC transporter substrate-binding protein [Plantibacter sp. Leaf171]
MFPMPQHRLRRQLFTAAIAVTALVLTGCTGPSAAPTPDADATLRVGLVLEPSDLDIRTTSGAALEQILIDNVYQGLVSRTEDDRIVDTLASSHEISADGLTYTFVLRDGVTFHDGAPLTAADVVDSLTQVQQDASFVDHLALEQVESITAVDDGTVRLQLGSPDTNLLWALTGRAGLVLHQGATNDRSTTAVGTGPFTLQSWKQGDSITFERNDAYWGDAPQVKEVVFSYIPDAASAVNATLAGELDAQIGLDANLRDQVARAEGFTVTEGKTTDKYTLAFNNRRAPLDDPRVREALRTAIDHAAIVEAVGGAAVEQYGPIPELDPGYEDLTGVVTYDPDRAKALLAEAGQEDLALTLVIPNHYGTAASKVLVSQFAAVGVTLTVDSVEFPTWLNDVYTNHDYDLSFVNHVEARDFQNWANPDYYYGYDNPQVQALAAEARTATDPATADAKLREAAALVSNDHAADWLYTAITLTVVRDGVTGFPTDFVSEHLDLSDVAVAD